MSFSLRFGDFTLEGCAEWLGSSPSRVSVHYFPRRHGAIATRVPTLDSKIVNLHGEVWKDSEAQIIQYLELLGKKLRGHNRLYLRDNDRYLNAVKESFEPSFSSSRSAATCLKYNLRFRCDDPHWYAPAHSEQVESIGAVNTATFAVTNNGGALTPVVFQITRTDPANDQANVKLTHTTTGLFLQWAGSLPDGQSVIFDTVNHRVIALGGGGENAFTGSIRVELEPGLNNFEYVGPGNVDIVIAWQERWEES